LMENELLELWSADRKSVVFITHDLEEAISLSDRVVVLSAGPASHPIGDYAIDLPRPRDVAEIRLTSRFIEIHAKIWRAMTEEVLAFLIGAVSGVVIGLWLALTPTASAVLDPYIKAINAMPRVILAPIFFVWFGLGIASKVALGVTLVFFIVFFNVYQGVREVSPVVLANARMVGASPRQLLRDVSVPRAMSGVFASLPKSVGLAVV